MKPNSRKQWYEIILKNHAHLIDGKSQVVTVARVKSPGLAQFIAKNLRETLYTAEAHYTVIVQ